MADWTYTPEPRKPFDTRNATPLPRDWTHRAKRQLRREPQCAFTERNVRCVEPATEVDHIIPRFEGGGDDEGNLQSLCEYHHTSKTQAEANRAWAKYKRETLARFDMSEPHPLGL